MRNFFVAAVLAMPAAGAQSASQPADLAALTSRLEKAAINEDVQGVKDARAAVMKLLEAAPASPGAPILRYTIAYAGWRLSFSPALPAAEQEAMVGDAETQLTEATKTDAAFADAYALLYAVYGARIARNADLGMTLGPAAGEVLGHALSLDGNNPRVVLMQGISLLYTPEEYGGNPKQSEGVFRRALELFEKEPAGKAWPSWGRFDTHVSLGLALAKRGDAEGARAEYKAALEIAPGSNWVKGLMAQLKG
jgi:tetratricopeptide (TPR) repeat protein